MGNSPIQPKPVDPADIEVIAVDYMLMIGDSGDGGVVAAFYQQGERNVLALFKGYAPVVVDILDFISRETRGGNDGIDADGQPGSDL